MPNNLIEIYGNYDFGTEDRMLNTLIQLIKNYDFNLHIRKDYVEVYEGLELFVMVEKIGNKYVVNEKQRNKVFIIKEGEDAEEMLVIAFFYILNLLTPAEVSITYKYCEDELSQQYDTFEEYLPYLKSVLKDYPNHKFGTPEGVQWEKKSEDNYNVYVMINDKRINIDDNRCLMHAVDLMYIWSAYISRFNQIFKKHKFDERYEEMAKAYFLFGKLYLIQQGKKPILATY